MAALTLPARRPLLTGAVAAVLLAAVFAGWSGVDWFRTANGDTASYGRDRDAALNAGRTLVAELTTLDSHQVDRDLGRWLDASTGPLHDQLAAGDAAARQTLAQGGTVATGKVLDAAVSELDQHAGTAKLLASVEISVTAPGSAVQLKRNRFAAGLTRTPAGWKLSSLDQLPVGTR